MASHGTLDSVVRRGTLSNQVRFEAFWSVFKGTMHISKKNEEKMKKKVLKKAGIVDPVQTPVVMLTTLVMGLHPRLGENSPVHLIDSLPLQIIADAINEEDREGKFEVFWAEATKVACRY